MAIKWYKLQLGLNDKKIMMTESKSSIMDLILI